MRLGNRLDRRRRAYDVHVHGVATRAHRKIRGQYAELPLLEAHVEEVWTGLKEEHQAFAMERLGVARNRPLRDRLIGPRVPGQERRQRGAREPRDARVLRPAPPDALPRPLREEHEEPKDAQTPSGR